MKEAKYKVLKVIPASDWTNMENGWAGREHLENLEQWIRDYFRVEENLSEFQRRNNEFLE